VHEVAVAQRMVEIALRAADENGGGRVVAARLLLGTLTCVDPETLDFAFGIATRGTLAQGCRLEIVRIPARLRCSSCRSEHERELLEPCPVCGAVGGEVLAGRELRLDTIDLEEAKTSASCVAQSAATGGSL
jgi:hydrogenase nickel incorporation protein HypA/HybF